MVLLTQSMSSIGNVPNYVLGEKFKWLSWSPHSGSLIDPLNLLDQSEVKSEPQAELEFSLHHLSICRLLRYASKDGGTEFHVQAHNLEPMEVPFCWGVATKPTTCELKLYPEMSPG